jgi:hypothetical protein
MARRRALSIPALVLALLVPARAAALCCIDGPMGNAGERAEGHSGQHHGGQPDEERFGEGSRALLPAVPATDCETPAPPAPAVRERDTASAAHAVIPAPLATPRFASGSSTGPVAPPDADRHPAHREASHPLQR